MGFAVAAKGAAGKDPDADIPGWLRWLGFSHAPAQKIQDQLDEFKKLPAEERAKQTLLSAAPLVAGMAAGSALSKEVTSLSPASIRFSQSSVNGVEELAASMRANGWKGAPIDVVRMSDGTLTTFDNTRVLAAQRAGINVQAVVHQPGEAFPAGRWTPRNGVQPVTWEDAVRARIQQQNSGYRNTYPSGSPYTGSTQ